MKKMLSVPVLTAGILTLFVPLSNAAKLAPIEITVPLTPTVWQITLPIPKYDPSLYPGFSLTGIQVTGTSQMIGTYTITSLTSAVDYGLAQSDITAQVNIKGPSLGGNPSIDLNVSPTDSSVKGSLPPNTTRVISVQGKDTRTISIAPIYFGLFQGSSGDTVNFNVEARDLIIVSLSGAALQSTQLQADLKLSVVYENNAPPLEIPEPDFNFLGLSVFGLAGLALKLRNRA